MEESSRVGQLDLGNLPQYWRLIAQEFQRIGQLPALEHNRILSARAFDESQVAGPRTYIEVTRYLSVAKDNNDALIALLRHHGATVWAPWSLLRPTFETAFRAAWILDPDDGRERRTRGLRSEVLDYYEQRRHRDAFKAFSEVRELLEMSDRKDAAGSLRIYKDEAVALGKQFNSIHQRVNVIAELPRLSFVKAQHGVAPLLEATWRLLSGFEHGLGWALLKGTDRKVKMEVPGGAHMELVVNDEAFVTAAKACYFLLLSACRLLIRRHTQRD